MIFFVSVICVLWKTARVPLVNCFSVELSRWPLCVSLSQSIWFRHTQLILSLPQKPGELSARTEPILEQFEWLKRTLDYLGLRTETSGMTDQHSSKCVTICYHKFIPWLCIYGRRVLFLKKLLPVSIIRKYGQTLEIYSPWRKKFVGISSLLFFKNREPFRWEMNSK